MNKKSKVIIGVLTGLLLLSMFFNVAFFNENGRQANVISEYKQVSDKQSELIKQVTYENGLTRAYGKEATEVIFNTIHGNISMDESLERIKQVDIQALNLRKEIEKTNLLEKEVLDFIDSREHIGFIE